MDATDARGTPRWFVARQACEERLSRLVRAARTVARATVRFAWLGEAIRTQHDREDVFQACAT